MNKETTSAANSGTCECVVGCLIPSHLVDAFDAMGPRIVEWMESDNWKPNR